MYDEACDSYKVVCTTQGTNGYPKNVKSAVIGFDDFGEAEEFANRHGGVLVILYQKNGWDLWQLKGIATEPFTISAEDFGEEYTAWSYKEKDEWWEHEKFFIKDRIDKLDADEFIRWGERIDKICEGFDSMYDGELLLLHNGQFDCIVKQFVVRHSYDSQTYIIGVMDEQDL